MAIPITQKARTNYGSAPKTGEVTVDARGTQVANFERMSPVKMADQSLIAGASAMGMGNVRENLAPVDLSYLTSAFEDNLSEEEKNKLAHERSNKYYNRQAKKKARQDDRAARKNK